MHAHFYWLKKQVRQDGKHFAAFKLRASDFKGAHIEQLQKLGIQDYAALNDTLYLLVNEDMLKLAVRGRLSRSDRTADIPLPLLRKFVTNPFKIETKDDLFDLLDLNRGTPIKYLLTTSVPASLDPQRLPLLLKLFRKFFYEHSAFIEPEVLFAELSPALAQEVFAVSPKEPAVLCVQNRNRFLTWSADSASQVKLFNLDLEVKKYEGFDSKRVEAKVLERILSQ
jgi:hypothetical protein